MDKLKKGDTVKLKSGGPLMTVQNLGNYSDTAGIVDGVLCVWFEGSTRHQAVFDHAVLVQADK